MKNEKQLLKRVLSLSEKTTEKLVQQTLDKYKVVDKKVNSLTPEEKNNLRELIANLKNEADSFFNNLNKKR
ncbi:hypothetical protein [Ferdinandcohnia sp. SAFN-114]|uniref:hypothetical protein n=1 Tax=Ferdinandcohnia sp. SAFN-114 TaxID=3387275 RepID=UPI003F7F646F